MFGLLERADIADHGRRAQLDLYLSALSRRVLPKRAAVYPVYANKEIQQDLIDRFFGSGSAEHRRGVECKMSEALEKVAGNKIPVMLYCPAGHMQLKQAKVLVPWPGAQGFARLADYVNEAPRLRDLEQSYTRRWKSYVHVLSVTTPLSLLRRTKFAPSPSRK